MYLIFDIGGTNMRISVSEDGQNISEPKICKTVPESFEDSMKCFIETAQELTQGRPITAIAGGVPGPMDADKAVVVTAPNMPDWQGKPLKERLAQELKAPVLLENDTVMIGMGEASQGAGKGHDIVAYLTVSTGVGGARIEHGKPSANALGFEPGHQIIDIRGPECGCGSLGHLEAVISGAGIKKQNGKSAEEVTNQDIWDTAAYQLAIGLNNVLVFWSPNVVVIGGSVMKSIDIVKVRTYLQDIITIYPTIPPIERAALGETGGLIGALAYLKQQGY
ncbi:MAG: ROK family protein [Candidatus Andersenbacteria bacterium]